MTVSTAQIVQRLTKPLKSLCRHGRVASDTDPEVLRHLKKAARDHTRAATSCAEGAARPNAPSSPPAANYPPTGITEPVFGGSGSFRRYPPPGPTDIVFRTLSSALCLPFFGIDHRGQSAENQVQRTKCKALGVLPGIAPRSTREYWLCSTKPGILSH